MRLLLLLLLASGLATAADDSSTFLYDMTRGRYAPLFGAVPAKGEARVDPHTGATLRRMTAKSDVAGQTDSLVVYSRFSSTNCDGTYGLIHGMNSTSSWVIRLSDRSVLRVLLDGSGRSIGENHEIRWDAANPALVYYVRDMSFYRLDVTSGASTRIRDFTADFAALPGSTTTRWIMNDVEGDCSNDCRYWCWMVMTYDGSTSYTRAIFTYDKQTDTILGTLKPSDFPSGRNYAGLGTLITNYAGLGYLPRPNMVEISPLGRKAIIDFDRCYAGWRENDVATVLDGPHAWPLNLAESSLAPSRPVKVGIDATHSGWSLGLDGTTEYFVSQNNRNDWIEAVDISTGTAIQLISNGDWGWNSGMHFVKMYRKRGWAMIGFYGSSGSGVTDWGDHQIIAVQIAAAPKILRITPSYMTYPGDSAYRNEAQAALSRDGTQVWWTCNWGQAAAGSREAYMVQLPANWDTIALAAPTLSLITASAITASGASITWATDKGADAQVEYGPTAAYGASTALAAGLARTHGAALSGLAAATTYHYRVKSRDSLGQLTTSADLTFTTTGGGAGDTTPPSITTPATASPATVAGTTATLAVGASDDSGAGGLTYTWSVAGWSGDGASAAGFSPNASHGAATTVTFAHAGTYTFTVSVADAAGNSVASSTGTVVVAQTATTLAIAEVSPSVASAGTVALHAGVRDQFGDPLAGAAVAWSVDAGGAGGTVSAGGVFTAPSVAADASSTVRATSASASATTTVRITAGGAGGIGQVSGTAGGGCGAGGIAGLLLLGLAVLALVRRR